MAERIKPRTPRRYSTGNPELDKRVADLVSAAGDSTNVDLLAEMIITTLRLIRDDADRGEMKLINGALKEFAYAFKVFRRWQGHRKVSIFGSARTQPHEPLYDYTRKFGAACAAANWMVITGAGPGIMAAGHEGAGSEKSFGASIRLPFETEPNIFIQGNTKLINFKYFFTRKVTFIKESDGFALFPGGFGTLDEAFELLTLMQTGKSDLHPIVLMEEPGRHYWSEWLHFVEHELLDRSLIDREDLNLVKRCRTIQEAVEELTGFYRNYQSQRYIGGRLVIRVLRLPPPEAVEELNRSFADIAGQDGIEPAEASPREIADGDELDLKRLSVNFNQTSYGRLRRLIDSLNQF
jgi:uncharacterized protein (TIGR00730 family)